MAFGEKSRILGTAAKNQMIANLKNTLFGFKRFIGRNYKDPQVVKEAQRCPFEVTSNEAGRVVFAVDYLKERKLFTPEQASAMLLTKLRQTSETALNQKVSDCVISVSYLKFFFQKLFEEGGRVVVDLYYLLSVLHISLILNDAHSWMLHPWLASTYFV